MYIYRRCLTEIKKEEKSRFLLVKVSTALITFETSLLNFLRSTVSHKNMRIFCKLAIKEKIIKNF